MEKIIRTKKPSSTQIKRMVANLRERHDGFASLQMFVCTPGNGWQDESYWISAKGQAGHLCNSWTELQNTYERLMEG